MSDMNKISNQLNLFCDKVLKKAKSAGLSEYEVYAIAGSDFDVEISEKEIENYNVNDFTGVSFRTMVNGKMGYASTTSLDDFSVDMLINKSQENASVIEDEDKQFIFGGSDSYETPKSYKDEGTKTSPEEKIEFAKKMEEYVLAEDKRVKKVDHCTVSDGVNTVVIKNSKGLNLTQTGNFITAVCGAVIEDKGEMNNSYSFRAGYSLDELDAKAIAKEAVKEAIDLCAAESIKSGKYKIIVRNDAFGELINKFSSIFSSECAQKGLSLLVNKEGTQIASPCFSLTDDATMDWGYSSRGFDDEGVATKKLPIVENGILKTFLYNLKTANKANVDSTGNATKAGYAGAVGVSGSNWVVTPGKKNLEELAKTMGSGLIITDLAGLHSGADSISGDFSLSVKGYLVEKGEIGRGVSGITLSGNFYKLIKDIKEVGSDTFANPMGGESMYTPSVLLGEMSIAGK